MKGGSIQYVERPNRELVERNVALRLGDPIKEVKRGPFGLGFQVRKVTSNILITSFLPPTAMIHKKMLADADQRELKHWML